MLRTWDVETTTHTLFKRKASPFDPRNWVVTHAWKDQGSDQVHETRFGRTRPQDGWLVPVLAGVKVLAGFNLKFDLLHALYQYPANLKAFMDYVTRGGIIWDCQLAEYLLEGMTQENQMLSLDEVAPRYGGQLKFDEVKVLWAAGVGTEEIDPEMLSRYLCGVVDKDGVVQNGDIGNTETIALAQLARARESGQTASLVLNMGALLFSIEAERNGMHIDKELGLQLAKGLEERIKGLEGELATQVAGLPFTFNWSSSRHKSALLFGGTVTYKGREYKQVDGTFSQLPGLPTQAFAQKPLLVCQLLDGTTLPVDQSAGLEVVRFKAGKQAGEVKTKTIKVDDLDKPLSRICDTPYTFPQMTPPLKAWAGSVPGVYSTSAGVMAELGKRDLPFLKTLSDYMGAVKDLGTYFIKDEYSDTGELIRQTGMLTLVDDTGIIHHTLNHVSTVTARLSSSNPNLQNISSGAKSEVKRVFTSRFDGGQIVQSDFSSLEVYVQAILSGSTQLIEDLKRGVDLHCVRLAAKEGRPYDEVVKLAKGYSLPDGTVVPAVKEWARKRTVAKTFSFQRAYGAGVAKIAAETGMSVEEVQALADAEDAMYPEINRYYASLSKEIKKRRQPTGRVIPHPDLPSQLCHLGKAQIQTPDGKLYTFTEAPSPEYLAKRGQLVSFSPTELRNYPVQGTGGEWAKAAMLMTLREFYRRGNFGGRALIVNQVHDAVYLDTCPTVAKEAAATLHACMLAASDYMAHTFKWDIPLPVPCETGAGPSMMEEAPLQGSKEAAGLLLPAIRSRYFKGYKSTW